MQVNRAMLFVLAITAGACGPGGEPPAEAVGPDSIDASTAPVLETALVDTSIAPAVAGENGWEYEQSVTADLNGDGEPERAVITAQVAMMRGRPVWDDGQPWQVYIEAADSTRTYVYARFVQLGMVTMRLTRPDSGATPTLVLIDHRPDALWLYEAEYEGPGQVRTYRRFHRMLNPVGDLASPVLP